MSKNSKIGLWAAVSIGVNAMIGAGVLVMPANLANKVGPAGIFTCFFSIAAVLFIGLSLGRAAEVYPGEGWSYLYPSKWGGHILGIISGFTYLFGVIIAMGFLADFVGIWFHDFIPAVSAKVLGSCILLLLTLLVLVGTKIASWGQYIIAGFVIIPLTLIAIFTWINFDSNLLTPFMPNGIKSVFDSTPVILFSLLGFECIASLYAIVKNPKRNVPIAFMISIGIVGFLYMAFIYGILFSVPRFFFAQGLIQPLSDVLANFFISYKFLSILVLVGACFAMLGTLHSMIWSIGALLKSVVGKTKLTPVKKFFNVKFWNSDFSVITTAVLVFIFSKILNLSTLLYLPVFLVACSYVLSISSLLFVRNEWKSGRNIITLLGLLSGGVIIYFSLLNIL